MNQVKGWWITTLVILAGTWPATEGEKKTSIPCCWWCSTKLFLQLSSKFDFHWCPLGLWVLSYLSSTTCLCKAAVKKRFSVFNIVTIVNWVYLDLQNETGRISALQKLTPIFVRIPVMLTIVLRGDWRNTIYSLRRPPLIFAFTSPCLIMSLLPSFLCSQVSLCAQSRERKCFTETFIQLPVYFVIDLLLLGETSLQANKHNKDPICWLSRWMLTDH